MHHKSIDLFLQDSATWARGPLALVFVEDEVEIDTTLRHLRDCRFATIAAFMPDAFPLAADLGPDVHRVTYDTAQPDAAVRVVAGGSSVAVNVDSLDLWVRTGPHHAAANGEPGEPAGERCLNFFYDRVSLPKLPLDAYAAPGSGGWEQS